MGYVAYSPYDIVPHAGTESRMDVVIAACQEEYPNESLARRGYLGTAPVKPSVAIAFRTLEAYRQLHYACPRLSIQAQVRALCRLHAVRDHVPRPCRYSSDHAGRLQSDAGDSIQNRI